MATTPIRSLTLMGGADLASTIDDTFDEALLSLDDATFLDSSTIANRPSAAAALKGTFFEPTDLPGYLYLSNGADWIEVAPGMGSIPIGSSLDWWAATDPGDTRFVRMDGRALSSTTYAELFSRLGNTYDNFRGASAPGAGLFRIPNLAGLTVVGVGTGNGLTNRVLGTSGGEEYHQLSVGEMPSHGHGVNDPGHTHVVPNTISYGIPPTFSTAGNQGVGQALVGSYPATTGISIQSQGGNGAHNTMQPFVVANRILRIA